ncbi:MAG: DUF4177 domain-containing protein [Candidatus Hydrogenedentes bacterium]|nr:DUF4177 domain-containing protein [Candidatus Hydrogenedentota bacterium]
MQISLIIESNGRGKNELDRLLEQGWRVVSVTPNHGRSYNDFLIILEKDDSEENPDKSSTQKEN